MLSFFTHICILVDIELILAFFSLHVISLLGSPRLLSLQIIGTAVEGTTLNVEKKYWGGEEGESIYRWFRVFDFIWSIISISVLFLDLRSYYMVSLYQ